MSVLHDIPDELPHELVPVNRAEVKQAGRAVLDERELAAAHGLLDALTPFERALAHAAWESAMTAAQAAMEKVVGTGSVTVERGAVMDVFHRGRVRVPDFRPRPAVEHPSVVYPAGSALIVAAAHRAATVARSMWAERS